MVMAPTSPGRNETLEDRYERLDPVIEDMYNGVSYRIYKIPRSRNGELVDSHYAVYIKIEEIFSDYENIRFTSLPYPPCHYGFNFGPTEDGWIGFGTLDGRDYNFDENGEPLDGDERADEQDLYRDNEILEITPDFLQNGVQDWIDETINDAVVTNI